MTLPKLNDKQYRVFDRGRSDIKYQIYFDRLVCVIAKRWALVINDSTTLVVQ